ncbi:metalloregulator ArsR/SmtB family transcription factor [Shewanella sp. GXUN23E]|uniref:metalloregulator ArsR/SmtB family transcription factor n=1 Tax=Shewanella sp. GXUN23E TaxID=3422498 RepID=UPI003D7EA4BD
MLPLTFFKALADDTRLSTLLLIAAEGELCVCELMAALQLPQPKISRHLALLRKEGLLADRRQGQWVFYRLNPQLPDWCIEILATTQSASHQQLAPALERLCAMGTRPERATSCC